MVQESDFDRLKRWGRKFLADWKGPAGNRNNGQAGGTGGDVSAMVSRFDSWPSLMRVMNHPDRRHRLFTGINGAAGNFCLTEPRRNLLILGPPRSSKTVGVLVPAIYCHPGPVVSTSTKDDVYRATAIVRARNGRLWHFNPAGGETLPGCIPLRWSPIAPSKDWAMAITLGKAMADTATSDGGGRGSSGDAVYFRTKAAVLTSCLLHAAALEDKPMSWLMRAVAGNRPVLEEAHEILDGSFDPNSRIAADDLRAIIDYDPRSRDPILSTTANAFAAYRLASALETTKNPNFNPVSFAAGQPDAFNPLRAEMPNPGGDDEHPMLAGLRFDLQSRGIYETIYITASTAEQALVAPIVAGLLSQIREATFALNRSDEARDYFSRPPVLWALDEMAGIAPMRDLPETLTQSGGQGLLVAGCLQDLHIARAKWDQAADGFLTLFGNVVVFPGIRDKATLEAISTVVGKEWVTVRQTGETSSRGSGGGQSGWSESTNEQLVPVLDPGAVSKGRVDQHPDFVLNLTPDGHGWSFCTPYYRQPPWTQMLIGSMAYAAQYGDVCEAAWDVNLPVLNRDQSGDALRACGGENLVGWHRWCVEALKDRRPPERKKWLEAHKNGYLSDYDDTQPRALAGAERGFIAIRPGVTAAQLDSAMERVGARQGNGLTTFIPMSMHDAINVADPPRGEVGADYVIEVGGHQPFFTIVPGGVDAKVRSGNEIITRFADQVADAAVLLEVWAFDRPALHIAGRLAAELAKQLSPLCWLTSAEARFYGSWTEPPSQSSRLHIA